MARLVVITKVASPSVLELGDGWITIGRGDDNIFQVLEQSVSTRHCEVRVQDGQLLVRDLLSTNGTFINGRKVSDGTLKAGDKLRLGDVELRFEAAGVPAAQSSGAFTAKRLMMQTAAAPKSAADPAAIAAAAEKRSSPAEIQDAGRHFNILFVDDSMAFIDSFGGLCVELSRHAWQLHKATSADMALEILRKVTVDLVVVDVGMPLVDGLQLLGIINRRSPGLKIVVITGNATEKRRADALAGGAQLFLEKPVTPQAMHAIFNLLQDVLLASREGFTGALRRVELQEVIQLECNSRRSSILEVRNPKVRGQIYLQDGEVVHAVAGELTGEKAFQQLVALREGEFHLKPFQPPPQRTISALWQYLLMNCTPVKDDGPVTASEDATTTPAPASGAGTDEETRFMVVGEDLMTFSNDEPEPQEPPPPHATKR